MKCYLFVLITKQIRNHKNLVQKKMTKKICKKKATYSFFFNGKTNFYIDNQ